MRARLSGESQRHLIVGLGNPGAKYAGHRHNVGFQCVDHLARTWGIKLDRQRFKAVWGQGSAGVHPVILAQPQTFMNDSGQAVSSLARWFRIPPERILVIYDDLDLPFAKLRLRRDGSSGGHRGVQSIIGLLGTRAFPRLRVGIGRPAHGDPIDYVLNDFARDQEPVLPHIYAAVQEIVTCYLDCGVREAMNAFNGLDTIDLGPGA